MLCENVLFLRILSFFNTVMNVLRFVVPIMLIVKTTLDIYHQILDVNDTSFKEKISKRIFAAVIVFLVPTFVNIFLSFLETITNMNFNYSECNANIKNINYYIERRNIEEKLAYESQSAENIKKYNEYLSNLNEQIKNSSNGNVDSTAIRIGKKYNVTDKQLENIAKVCQREQGRPEGAAAEAELMINKYVLSGYIGSFYDYLFNSSNGKWWHPIKVGNYGSTKLKPEIKEAVRKVVVEGQRKYPAYINEHDCISCGDVLYIKTDGQRANKNNRSEFVQDKTFVYTRYKQNSKVKYWIFYAFPDEKSDPFGYTYDAKDKLAAINK